MSRVPYAAGTMKVWCRSLKFGIGTTDINRGGCLIRNRNGREVHRVLLIGCLIKNWNRRKLLKWLLNLELEWLLNIAMLLNLELE